LPRQGLKSENENADEGPNPLPRCHKIWGRGRRELQSKRLSGKRREKVVYKVRHGIAARKPGGQKKERQTWGKPFRGGQVQREV